MTIDRPWTTAGRVRRGTLEHRIAGMRLSGGNPNAGPAVVRRTSANGGPTFRTGPPLTNSIRRCVAISAA